MKRPSIRKRLVFWTTLTVTVILIAGKSTLYSALEKSIYRHFDHSLDEGATVVMIEVEVENSQVYHEWREALKSDSLQRTKTLIQVWDQKTGQSVRSPALGDFDLEKKYGELGERIFYDLTLPDGSSGRAVGVLIHPNVEHPEENEGFVPGDHPQVFVWAQDSSDLHQILRRARRVFLVGGSIIIVLLWIVIWFLTTRLLRPIEEVAREVLSRQGDETTKPIPVPDRLPMEVAGMAEVFNGLLSKIDLSREKDRNFFLHVAHELRTPLAGVQFVIEQALRRPRSNEEYQRRLAIAHEGTQGINRLVNRLLKMGRVRRSGEKVLIEEFEIKTMMLEIWEGLSRKTDERGLDAQWDLDGGSRLASDADLVRLILQNLFDNAASYALGGSTVKIGTKRSAEDFLIVVENSIAESSLSPDLLSRFFDPFYRRDEARKSGEGHAGIGLGFCREIVTLLGGTIKAVQPKEGWISFQVSLPVPPEKNQGSPSGEGIPVTDS